MGRERSADWPLAEQNHMLTTAERANREESAKIKKKQKKAAFGWSMFNQDSLHKGHEKRAASALKGRGNDGREVRVGGAGSKASTSSSSKKSSADNQRDGHGAASSNTLVLGGQPSSAAMDRMVAELDERSRIRSNFSRRREVFEEEHTTHINESNRKFNKKLSRAYDKYTVELRQSLERGTA